MNNISKQQYTNYLVWSRRYKLEPRSSERLQAFLIKNDFGNSVLKGPLTAALLQKLEDVEVSEKHAMACATAGAEALANFVRGENSFSDILKEITKCALKFDDKSFLGLYVFELRQLVADGINARQLEKNKPSLVNHVLRKIR